MEVTSLKSRIARYFKERDHWINAGDIERLAMEKGYKSSNASRRLRELAEDGVLERELRKGKKTVSVWYRWRKPVMPVYTGQLTFK